MHEPMFVGDFTRFAAPFLLTFSLVGCSSGSSDDAATTSSGGGAATTASASSASTYPCELGFLGDPAGEPQVLVRYVDQDLGTLVEVNDGDTMPISTPPQGGRVIFTAFRATNIVPCSVSVVATLADSAGTGERSDARTVNLAPQGDGWGESDPENFGTVAHLPVCPNVWSTQDIFDKPYNLTVTLTDKEDRVAETTVSVLPGCLEGGALNDECHCICAAGYEVGSPCP